MNNWKGGKWKIRKNVCKERHKTLQVAFEDEIRSFIFLDFNEF